MNPGTFRQTGNQAGTTIFVAPELVDGTLEEGFNGFAELASPGKHVCYAMFIVARPTRSTMATAALHESR